MRADILERPIVSYLIIGIFSVAAAMIFFKLGGSFAKISGQENTLLGFSFEASGALGGFFLIFWISLRALGTLRAKAGRIHMKLHLNGKPENFERRDDTYICTYWLYNEDTGESHEFPDKKTRWEAGYLTVDIRDVGPNDLIGVRIKNAQNKVWQSDYFHSRAKKMDIQLLDTA